jgi:hypothetical protein
MSCGKGYMGARTIFVLIAGEQPLQKSETTVDGTI